MPNSVRVCEEQLYKNEGLRRAGFPEQRVKADALDALDASMGPALQKNDLVAWAKADDELIAILTTAKKVCHNWYCLRLQQGRKLIGMNFAVLGLGIIGSAWARNLIADGHAVRCWNRTPRDFPNFYPSIQDAVEEAEAIFVIVADPPAVQSVLDQIALHLGPDKIVVQSSTISARWTQVSKLASAHEERDPLPSTLMNAKSS